MTRYTWIRGIVEDPEHPGELLLDLGPELCEYMGWQIGDTIEWHDNGDGSWTIKRPIDKSADTK